MLQVRRMQAGLPAIPELCLHGAPGETCQLRFTKLQRLSTPVIQRSAGEVSAMMRKRCSLSRRDSSGAFALLDEDGDQIKAVPPATAKNSCNARDVS